MQSLPDYHGLAGTIVNSNDPKAYAIFSELMANPTHIWNVFNSLDGSQNLLFVACEILGKKLNNKELPLSEDETDGKEGKVPIDYVARKNMLLKVGQKIYSIVLQGKSTLPRFIIKSCINIISIFMKSCLISSSSFDSIFVSFLGVIQPAFIPNLQFIKPSNILSDLTLINPDPGVFALPEQHNYAVPILVSVLEYVMNSTYFDNYYYFRRNIYFFRNQYLGYFLNYAVFATKILFRSYNKIIATNPNPAAKAEANENLRAVFNLLEQVVMYPFSLNMHEGEVEDEIHDNISGNSSQIYFPTYFRNFLCDTPLLMDIVSYYGTLMKDANSFQEIRTDIYSLIRILGRCMSASQYVFINDEERKTYRGTIIQFSINILLEEKFLDTYLILCIVKICTKIMRSFSKQDYNNSKDIFFQTAMNYVKKVISQASGKIEDGEKHPIRQSFELMVAIIDNGGPDEGLQAEVKVCGQDVLELLYVRLTDNEENAKMMRDFGYNNRLEVECFEEIFVRVPEIFKLNISRNLLQLKNLNVLALEEPSITCWLHLCSLLLPNHDTSKEQTELILKFFHIAVNDKLSRSISSLHYIKTLVSEILTEIQDGVSSTYLWKFMQDSLMMDFENFLTKIINYTVEIFMVPNYNLIENALDLFKATFTKLCKVRHRSFKRYFDIVENVSKEIDKTMLAHQDYMKLRIGYFSVISLIWINEGQVGFVYRIIANIRDSLGRNNDILHFMRYLTDLTGILDPIQSSDIFKTLAELILMDMETLLPFYLGSPEKIQTAFSSQIFLRTFIKFLLVLVNDSSYRLSIQNQTNLPFIIQQKFRPFLIQALKYEYPKKTVQLWTKFIKLNPLSELLPFDKTLKEKNSPLYRTLLREYFENLHRFRSIEDFYYMYTYVEDNLEFMMDWWEEVMNRGWTPQINLATVVGARVWTTNRQKQSMAKLLYRIALYDSRYWSIQCDAPNENKYAEWFVANFN